MSHGDSGSGKVEQCALPGDRTPQRGYSFFQNDWIFFVIIHFHQHSLTKARPETPQRRRIQYVMTTVALLSMASLTTCRVRLIVRSTVPPSWERRAMLSGASSCTVTPPNSGVSWVWLLQVGSGDGTNCQCYHHPRPVLLGIFLFVFLHAHTGQPSVSPSPQAGEGRWPTVSAYTR